MLYHNPLYLILQVNVNVSEKLKELLVRLDKYKASEETLRLTSAKQSYKFEKLEIDKSAQDKRHAEEVRKRSVTCRC